MGSIGRKRPLGRNCLLFGLFHVDLHGRSLHSGVRTKGCNAERGEGEGKEKVWGWRRWIDSGRSEEKPAADGCLRAASGMRRRRRWSVAGKLPYSWVDSVPQISRFHLLLISMVQPFEPQIINFIYQNIYFKKNNYDVFEAFFLVENYNIIIIKNK